MVRRLVPIHAYPVMNETVFPQKVDFGLCLLGKLRKKALRLECKVPIQFEYEISVTRPHPDFRVYPLKGMVPADGWVKGRPSVSAAL